MHKFAFLIGISKREAIGLLHQFWWWVIDYAPTGELEAFEPMQIAKGCEWEGDASKLLRSLREARFLDADPLRVHDWFDFCGDLVKRRIERLSEKRQKMSGFVSQTATKECHPTQPTQPTQPTNQGLSDKFMTFWRAYPKKIGKGSAERLWWKIKPSQELLQKMLHSIERFKLTPQWQKEEGQYIPMPATWLNQRRWEDEAEIESGKSLKVKQLEEKILHGE